MRRYVTILAVWTCCQSAAAQEYQNPARPAPGFQGLGDLPGGSFDSQGFAVNADGTVAVGRSSSTLGTEAFRWVSGVMTGLGDLPGGSFDSRGHAVSGNGSVVAGEANSALGREAFRWEAGVMTPLGDLPLGVFDSTAFGISNDGAVIVGVGNSAFGNEAFRWEGGVMTPLGDLAGGTFSSSARDASGDGLVVVGFAHSADGQEAFRWEGGVMTGLGDLPDGGFASLATAVSFDGSVVVGHAVSASGTEAFRWTSGGGMVGLGNLPGGGFNSLALGVSDDGSVVIGRGNTDAGFEAMIWDAVNGMRSLQDLLTTDLGLDLTGWQLTDAAAISPDGTTIVGHGINPDGFIEGWIATIAEPPGTTLQFREGVGYTGCVDTMLQGSAPATPAGSDAELIVDKSPKRQGLIRFDNIFGNSPGQIPIGSTILSASLFFDLTNPGDISTGLHRMRTSWGENDTWDDWNNGIQPDGSEAEVLPDYTIPVSDICCFESAPVADVTSSLQAWSDGTANYGWVLLDGGEHDNGWVFSSCDNAVQELRPMLEVTLAPPPDCNSNGVPDSTDIAGATSTDCNTNGIPDECETDCDDFEDGVIDSTLWVWGGNPDRGVGGGSWQFSHEEIIDTDGYLKLRVWGPTSGNSHGAEAWVRTQYDYNDGLSHCIDFRWGAEVNASHVDMYAVQITDGTIPGGTDLFWYGGGAGGTDGSGWTNLYFQSQQSDLAPTDWSIYIDGTNDTATLYDGPNLTGQIIDQKTLPAGQAWYVRFIQSDATSAGFPAGDNLLNVYDYCSAQSDIDGDGVCDLLDNCPQDYNPDQANSDGDSYGDACDNCDFDDNEDQADFDGDGLGDACDPDIDGDGVDNVDDVCDKTPLSAIQNGRVIDDPGGPLHGTIAGDLDGDCDCDLDDYALLQLDFTGPNG